MSNTEERTEQPVAEAPEVDGVVALERALRDERERSLAHLRRALLAEHAGSLVPELVAGDSPEALEASVEAAQTAFAAARAAALADLRREQAAASPPPPTPAAVVAPVVVPAPVAVPAGTPARDTVPADTAYLSPLQKIASGLRR